MLQRLQGQGLENDKIGQRLGGRTGHAVKVKLRKIGLGQPSFKVTPWSAQEIANLLSLRDEYRMGWDSIADRLGRPCGTVYSKYRYLKEGGPTLHVSIRPTIPDRVEADWRRRQALSPRDLTAALCGDPLPGFSALERRA